MVFAIETYWPTTDGTAARIEEEVLVTDSGPRVLTRFPAQQLLVAGTRYHSGYDLDPPPPPNGQAAEPATAVANPGG